jgi:hypothetical protein
MFLPISIDDFLKSYKENNPKEDIDNLRNGLAATVQEKKDGAICDQCKQPMQTADSGCWNCNCRMEWLLYLYFWRSR